jgi:threonine synthase
MAESEARMRYISTRGAAPPLDFEQVLLTGLAADGGLYVPEVIPKFAPEELAALAGLPYTEAAYRIMQPFVGEAIPAADFRRLIEASYTGFSHDAVAPLKQLAPNHYLLELFHGPTLAFKDIALQLLGRLLDHVLTRRGERGVVMGATSGDTGSAAIAGCAPCDHLDVFILHPHQRVSAVQRRQMTTVHSGNVHNIAIQGDFDAAQAIVKASFADQDFLRGRRLIAANSINWARIMAQIVYYVTAGVALGAPHREVAFAVPTANFGNLFAGYMARRMGLPVKQFVIATNANDILHRTLADNDFSRRPLQATLAPSMDIVVSSNFERLLFEAYRHDAVAVSALLERFNKSGRAPLDAAPLASLRELFSSEATHDEAIINVIREAHAHTGELLDPHTATAYRAANRCRRDPATPMITLATAHPAKFEEALMQAGFANVPEPEALAGLGERAERFEVLPAEVAEVQAYVAAHCR